MTGTGITGTGSGHAFSYIYKTIIEHTHPATPHPDQSVNQLVSATTHLDPLMPIAGGGVATGTSSVPMGSSLAESVPSIIFGVSAAVASPDGGGLDGGVTPPK